MYICSIIIKALEIMTIQEAQDLRKEGFTIVVNNTYKKVLLVTKNEDEAYELKNKFLLKNKVVKVFGALVKVYKTKKAQLEDIKKANEDLRLGLNFRL